MKCSKLSAECDGPAHLSPWQASHSHSECHVVHLSEWKPGGLCHSLRVPQVRSTTVERMRQRMAQVGPIVSVDRKSCGPGGAARLGPAQCASRRHRGWAVVVLGAVGTRATLC